MSDYFDKLNGIPEALDEDIRGTWLGLDRSEVPLLTAQLPPPVEMTAEEMLERMSIGAERMKSNK